MSDSEKNKELINRFDEAFYGSNDESLWSELVSEKLTDHTATEGPKVGKDSFRHFFKAIHAGLSNINVEVIDQVAENDLVVTHKIITGDLTGELFGVAPTNYPLNVDAIEIIRVKDGKYIDHWVRANLWEQLAKHKANVFAVRG